jgi:hypothetical protein
MVIYLVVVVEEPLIDGNAGALTVSAFSTPKVFWKIATIPQIDINTVIATIDQIIIFFPFS